MFKLFTKKPASYAKEVSAKERAAELGCRIRAAIDEGKFELGVGYLRPNGEACGGCAVAAAAFACGCRRGNQEDPATGLNTAIPIGSSSWMTMTCGMRSATRAS